MRSYRRVYSSLIYYLFKKLILYMITKNNSLGLATSFALACSLLLFGAATALAASDNASTNESFVQGLQKNGGAVNVLRSNPADALGATDGAFVTLGYGGELTVGFAQNMSGNLLLAVQETTGGVYPLETADVYVSTDATGPWTFVGEATNEAGTDDGITSLAVEGCYQYVQIIDTTDGDLHNDTSDGFDVDSLTADYDETCPVVEEPEDDMPKATHVNISLHSGAMVMNETETVANTGNNLADGSYAGAGGNGGDIDNNGGEQDVEGSATGNGGTGGDAGLGGAVQTGDALAVSSIANTVNSNVVRVDSCDCDGTLGRVRVRTHDFAFVGNRAGTAANTGDNSALGSYAGDAGAGGDIENGNRRGHGGVQDTRDNENGGDDDDADQEVDDSTTGAGGNGGASDAGGSVLTGTATTRASIVNLVNSNRIRIR
jgi:hypothetical protein